MSKIDARFVDGASFAPIYDNAEAHNRILRNTKLTLNSDLFTNVKNGSFEGIYPGCYFEFEDVTFYTKDVYTRATVSGTYSGKMRVADLNYFSRVKASLIQGNYMVVIPDDWMFIASMNNSATSSGGYPGTRLFEGWMFEDPLDIFKACFGAEHIIRHNLYFPENKDVWPDQYRWYQNSVVVPNSAMMTGQYSEYSVMLNAFDDPYADAGADAQLSLFRLDPDMLLKGTQDSSMSDPCIWLRDIRADQSSNGFLCLDFTTGEVGGASANAKYGVRPYALIG